MYANGKRSVLFKYLRNIRRRLGQLGWTTRPVTATFADGCPHLIKELMNYMQSSEAR